MFPLSVGDVNINGEELYDRGVQAFTDYNPLSSLADAARGLMTGGPIAHDLLVTLGWSVGLTAVMAPIAIHKFKTKS